MSESVLENDQIKDDGFSACCKPYDDDDDDDKSCLESGGPNGYTELLTSSYARDNNGTESFLFAQDCQTYDGRQGIVTEIFYGWVGGFSYLQSPLYGSKTKLPATTSWARVVHDDHDPMCVH